MTFGLARGTVEALLPGHLAGAGTMLDIHPPVTNQD